MHGKTRGIVWAYLWPLLWAAGGFVAAELLRWLAEATATRWPATLAVWLSLLALVAATARASWVSWRLWRGRGETLPPADGAT